MAPSPSSDARPIPGISVVIPAYNYAQFLPNAIESVLQQNYAEYEIIVVDDGSTDNTAEVVAAYLRNSNRVRYVYKQNAGLSAARNTGIKQARFAFVGFLDADDEWLPNLLRRAMETFATQPTELAIVACHSIFVDAEGRTLNVKHHAPEQSQEITCRDLIFESHFAPSSVVARKSAFAECGLFDETLRSSEDRDMWLRIAARRRVLFLSDPLVRIRRHASNMSNHADRMKENVRRVIAKAYRSRQVPRSNVAFWLQVLSFSYFQAAWPYHGEGRLIRAIREMICSLLLWPWFLRQQRSNEPPLFRIRSLIRFFRAALTGCGPPRARDAAVPAETAARQGLT